MTTLIKWFSTVAFCVALILPSTLVQASDSKDSSSETKAKSGLVAHYYKDHKNWGGTWPKKGDVTGDPSKWTFTKYSYSRVEPLINHMFQRSGWFSIRWKGSFHTSPRNPKGDKEAVYTFHIWADDGCRLFIDGKKVIDSWKPTWEKAPEAHRKAVVRLKPGAHKVVIEYFQGRSLKKDDKDPIKLSWECPDRKIKKQIIPASHFSHDDDDFFSTPGRLDK